MIIHVDLANHYEQKFYSVLALVSVDMNKENQELQKCITIQDPIRKQLKKEFGDINLHSALIAMLIKDLTNVERIIICDDVRPYSKVEKNLNILTPKFFGRLKCLIELRKEIGDKGIRSAADRLARNISKNYPKRKNIHRRKPIFDSGNIQIIEKESDETFITLKQFLIILKEKQ